MLRQKSTTAPTAVQLAELNALLRETEDLARCRNDPVVGAVFTSLFLLLQRTVSSEALLQVLDSFFIDMFGQTAAELWLLFLAAVPAVLYVNYQLYQGVASLISRLFPNGVGYDRTKHRAYEMQVKLGTQKEVAALIKVLLFLY
jgi:hypothetical protein